MEMPEGWEKLNSNIPEGAAYHRVSAALDLMREMVEALAFYAHKDFSHPADLEIMSSDELGFSDAVFGTRAKLVLQKFKDWK